MAIAKSRFGELHEVWRSKKLPVGAKVRIYACAVVSVLTYGNEIWSLNSKTISKIRGWNARCLAVMTGRDFREETVSPTFDLISRLRSRRLRWAGHILRMEDSSLLKRVLLEQVKKELEQSQREDGGLLMDAAEFKSVEELVDLAQDRKSWRSRVLDLLPESDPTRKIKIKISVENLA